MSARTIAQPIGNSSQGAEINRARVAFVTNFIPPYWKPVLGLLSASYPNLRVLLSTAMEADRTWKVDWEGLDVRLQRTITWKSNVRNPLGFREQVYIHLPIDTVSQLMRFKADVVISTELGFRSLMSIVYRRLRPNSRLIVFADLSEHTEKARGRLRALIRKFISRRADHFLVLGESGARYIRTLGVANDRISRVPYSTDVTRFVDQSGRRTEQSARRLLYVGRLVERKGLLPFINCLVKWLLANPAFQLQLTLAGDGPLRRQLEEFDLPAGLRLNLLGDKDYRDMPAIYSQCDILVFPTLADTWGLVVNEALAAGLPVLGSVYSQAVEELIQDGWNGWKFRPDDAHQSYQAIETVMTTPAEALERMREYARNTATKLTPEHVADLINDVVRARVAGLGSAGDISHVQ